jgi:hypothetical protein
VSSSTTRRDQPWEALFRNSWGRRLAVLSVADESERPTLEDGLSILAATLKDGPYKISVDGAAVFDPVLPPHLQCSTGDDLASLMNTMLALFNGEMITISAHNLQSLSSDLYFKARKFLAPVTAKFGLPGGGINTFTIAGKYRSTSVGIHCDPCDIFLFPLFGSKTIYGWETSKFIERVSDLEALERDGAVLEGEPYERHLDGAQCVHAKPGEVIYIPAKYWHINVLDKAEPSIAIGMSLFSNRSAGELVMPVLNRALKDPKHSTAFKSFAPPQIGIGESIDKVAHVEGAEGFLQDLRRALVLNLMQRTSACGFVTGTPHDNQSPTPTIGAWRLRDEQSTIIAFVDGSLDEDHMFLAANGALCKTGRSVTVQSIINRLNAGESVSIPARAVDVDGDEMIDLLGFLRRCKAIVEVRTGMEHS